jgi:ubiquinone biosynthesis protein
MQEIMTVLVRYGFSGFIDSLRVRSHLPFSRRRIASREDEVLSSHPIWTKIRLALQDLGPSFIKLGQIFSNRPDVLPAPLIGELEKLQDRVPPFSTEEAIRILEEEFQQPVARIFRTFGPEAVASASVAQVHQAVTWEGETVAVKILRPNIERTVRVDVEIMNVIAHLVERNLPELRVFKPVHLVREFDEHISRELNFSNERLNMQRFAEDFRHDPTIHVPKVYEELSTRRVITQEYIHGVKVSDLTPENDQGYDRQTIAERGTDLILTQIFLNGFFHADPHPGNILVLRDNVVCFLDFGMMGSLPPFQRDYLCTMMIGIVNRDPRRIMRGILEMSGNEGDVDFRGLESALFSFVQRYVDLPLQELNIAQILTELLRMIRSYNLDVPTNFAFLAKALITMQNVGERLSPGFQVIRRVEAFSQQLYLQELDPKRILEESYTAAMDYRALLRDLPSDLRDIFKLIYNKHFQLDFRHLGLEPFRATLNQISYRLVFGFIIGSLLVSSSLIIQAELPPHWYGISIFGIAGFFLGGVMLLGMLVSIVLQSWRNRRQSRR